MTVNHSLFDTYAHEKKMYCFANYLAMNLKWSWFTTNKLYKIFLTMWLFIDVTERFNGQMTLREKMSVKSWRRKRSRNRSGFERLNCHTRFRYAVKYNLSNYWNTIIWCCCIFLLLLCPTIFIVASKIKKNVYGNVARFLKTRSKSFRFRVSKLSCPNLLRGKI